MIIGRIIGGLGNQMFQYAMVRNIAHRNQSEFKLDITPFKWYKLHAYGLHHLNTIENIATEDDIRQFVTSGGGIGQRILSRSAEKVTNLVTPYYKRRYIKEKGFPYDANMEMVSPHAYLDGYWASEKYFTGIEDIIRTEFTVKTPPDEKNNEIAGEISRVPSVSVHFRRGDYVLDPATSAVHGVCPVEYYHKAIEDLVSRIDDPHFFVFSNDPEFVRENFNIQYPMKIVDINGPDRNYEDLRLMSLCRHHIIANSTFSWWGAWLGMDPHKIVYSPRRWYKVDYDTRDLLPESWRTI
jgi:hypothetical protein